MSDQGTVKIRSTSGERVVMYGRVILDGKSQWFERYFKSADLARKYAGKKGWEIRSGKLPEAD